MNKYLHPNEMGLTRRGKGKQKAGARNEIASKFPSAEYADFNWGLYYISSHGLLSQDVFIVPENTYILNLSTTGKGCSVMHWDIERLFYSKSDSADDMDAKRQEIFNKLKSGLTKNMIEGKSEYIHTKGDISLDVEELYGKKGARSLAFYEPGDIIFDCHFFFRNTGFPMFLMGTYALPMKRTIWENVVKANRPVAPGVHPNAFNLSNLKIKDIEASNKKQLLEKGDKLFNLPENLVKDVMFDANGDLRPSASSFNVQLMRGVKPEAIPFPLYSQEQFTQSLQTKTPPANNPSLRKRPATAPYVVPGTRVPTLYDIVRQLNHTDGRPKLIFVHACRTIEDNAPYLPKSFTPRFTRRMSLAARERTSNSGTTRPQLNRAFLEALKAGLDSDIAAAKPEGTFNLAFGIKKKTWKEYSDYLQGLLDRGIFDHYALLSVLRNIRKLKGDKYLKNLPGSKINDRFANLLELNVPAVKTEPPKYTNELAKYVQTIVNAQKAAATQKAKKTGRSSIPTLLGSRQGLYTSFMGNFGAFLIRIGQLSPPSSMSELPTLAEDVYWSLVNTSNASAKNQFKQFLGAINQSDLNKAGIMIGENGVTIDGTLIS